MLTNIGNQVILKIRAGSHLYGLNTASSDKDYLGVYLSTPQELLGLENSEIISENVESKKDNGRNDKNAVDCTYYSLQKFCKLALNANPTILEVLFANKENIVYCNDLGRNLLDSRHSFLSSKIKHSYLGYAFSQKQKSFTKSNNLRLLVDAKSILEKQSLSANVGMLYDNLDVLNQLGIKFIKNEEFPNYVVLADLRFNNQKIKDVYRKIIDRIDKSTHRADGILKHGLDYKFMSHTVRLLYEGLELLETGSISFPLKERRYLLNIKQGLVKNSDILDEIEQLESKVESLYFNTKLSHAPNFKAVNTLVFNIYRDYLKSELYRN